MVGGSQPAFAFVLSDMTSSFYIPDMAEMRARTSFFSWMFFVIAWGILLSTALQQWSFSVMGQVREIAFVCLSTCLCQSVPGCLKTSCSC